MKYKFTAVLFTLFLGCMGLLMPLNAWSQSLPSSERNALMEIYNALGGDGWTNNSGWKTGAGFSAEGTEHTWFGVNIDTIGGNLAVTALRLSNNNLAGMLPDSIGNFSFLEILELDSNAVVGEFPTPMQNLVQLDTLNFGWNQLNDTIPTWIGDLVNLKSLNLSANKLHHTLPDELGNLVLLEELLLPSNGLKGPIPASFASLGALTNLNISHNALFHSNGAVLSFLNGLQADWLDTQTLFPENFSATTLSAKRIELKWDSIGYMSDPGGYLIRYGKDATDLSDSLFIPAKDSISTILTDLENDSTYFFRIHAYTSPHSNNQNEVFSTTSPQISAKTLKSILPSEREALIALYEGSLGDEWTQNTNWKDTTGQFLEPGFEGTWYGVTLQEINDTLRVREIRLQNNNLQGVIAAEIGQMEQLFLLDLSGNELQGSIPSSVENLKALTRFIVNDNRLSGAIPPEIGGMDKVSIFLVKGNKLAGELPPDILQIPGSSSFDLRFNGLFSSDPSLVSAINNKGNTISWTNNQTLPPVNVAVANVKTTTASISWSPVSYTIQPGNYQLLIGTSSGVPLDTIIMGAKPTSSFDLTNLSPGTTYFASIQTITFSHSQNKNEVRSFPSQEVTFSTQALLPQNQRDALIALYNATGGDQWSNNTNWKKPNGDFNDPGTEDTWFGINTTLINTVAHVESILLNSNNLVGSLPDALSALTQLDQLEVANNKLKGSLPGTLGSLTNLRVLHLQSNALVGAVTNAVLDLSMLADLNLAYNGLFTDNDQLDEFLEGLSAGWKNTQTIAPDNFSSQEINPTSTGISWDPIAYQANDGGYWLKFGTSIENLTDSIFVNNKNSNEIVLTNLIPATTYWMRMYTVTLPNANNSNTVTSAESDLYQFFALPPPPSAVNLISPENLSKNQALNLTLRWEGMLGIQEYQIQVATQSDFLSGIILDASAPNANGFALENLLHNTRYYWRVRARNAGGFGPWSQTWDFKTRLATPFTTSPANPTCLFEQALTFTWQAVPGADRYIFQAAVSSDFSDLVIDNQNVSGPSVTITTLPINASYRWRVKAINSSGDESEWSPSGRIAVYEQISVQGPTEFCQGGSVLLSAPPNGSSYSWRRNGQIISGATQREFTATESGNYSVQIGTAIGCVLVADPVSVIVNSIAKPVINFSGPSVVCVGESKQLTTSVTAASYQWFLNGEAISGATNSSFSATTSGEYTVRAVSAQGCIGTSDPVSLRFDPLPTITAINGTAICEGQTTQLRASIGSSYQWFRNGILIQGAIQRNFFASESGNYTVEVQVAGGCSAVTEPIVVTVSSLPGNIISPSGAVSLCEGGERTLTAPFAEFYQWFRNGVALPAATNQVLQVNQPGTYSVVASNGTCNVTSQPVVVSLSTPPVAAISFTGSTDLCSGDSRTLSSTPGNGYQWFRNGIAIPGATNRNFVASEGGAYTVQVANSTGCTTLSDEVVFTLTTLPGRSISITGSTEVCEGEQVLLTAPEANTYQWFRNGIAISGATSRDFSAAQSGNYRVQVTNGGICSITSDPVEIVVNALPDATITLDGMEMTAPLGNYSYQWYSDGTPIAGATERSYLTFTSGTFSVQVTANTGVGCSVMSAPFDLIVTDLPQGQGTWQLDAYPNPANDILQLSIPKLGMDKAPEVEVYAMDGRRVGTYSSMDAGSHFKAELDVSSYKQANYLIVVRSPKAILRKRIIKH